MADRMRWRGGDERPVHKTIVADVVVEIGDLVYETMQGETLPASEVLGHGAFAEFLGVAMQRSRAGQVDVIRVATAGLFEFDCELGDYAKDEPVGPATIGGRWENQKLVKAASGGIGHVAKSVEQAGTVLVEIGSQSKSER